MGGIDGYRRQRGFALPLAIRFFLATALLILLAVSAAAVVTYVQGQRVAARAIGKTLSTSVAAQPQIAAGNAAIGGDGVSRTTDPYELTPVALGAKGWAARSIPRVPAASRSNGSPSPGTPRSAGTGCGRSAAPAPVARSGMPAAAPSPSPTPLCRATKPSAARATVTRTTRTWRTPAALAGAARSTPPGTG